MNRDSVSLNSDGSTRRNFPSYEELKRMYHLRSRSYPHLIGAMLIALGVLLAGFGIAFSIMPSEGLLFGEQLASLAPGLIAPGIITFGAGVLLMAGSKLKRQLIGPDLWEIRSDFVRAVLQEKLISRDFDKSQFRFKVRRAKRRLYEISFSLDFPNCTYDELVGPIKHIAASFGCPYTYSFEEDTSVGSKYSRRYRYRLKMELSDLGSAYKKAGV